MRGRSKLGCGSNSSGDGRRRNECAAAGLWFSGSGRLALDAVVRGRRRGKGSAGGGDTGGRGTETSGVRQRDQCRPVGALRRAQETVHGQARQLAASRVTP